jgi:hypothetical protein
MALSATSSEFTDIAVSSALSPGIEVLSRSLMRDMILLDPSRGEDVAEEHQDVSDLTTLESGLETVDTYQRSISLGCDKEGDSEYTADLSQSSQLQDAGHEILEHEMILDNQPEEVSQPSSLSETRLDGNITFASHIGGALQESGRSSPTHVLQLHYPLHSKASPSSGRLLSQVPHLPAAFWGDTFQHLPVVPVSPWPITGRLLSQLCYSIGFSWFCELSIVSWAGGFILPERGNPWKSFKIKEVDTWYNIKELFCTVGGQLCREGFIPRASNFKPPKTAKGFAHVASRIQVRRIQWDVPNTQVYT